MTTLPVTSRVPDELAAHYRAEGWWDDRRLADGLEAAGRSKPDACSPWPTTSTNSPMQGWSSACTCLAIVELIERDVGTNTGVVLVTETRSTRSSPTTHSCGSERPWSHSTVGRARSDVRFASRCSATPRSVVLPSSEHDRLAAEIGHHPSVLLDALADADPGGMMLAAG